MLTLFFLLFLLPIGNGQSELQQRFSPERAFPLPKYPMLPARMGLTGDFEVEMHWEEGSLQGIKVRSLRLTSSNATGTNNFDDQFIASIEDAVKSWHFDKKMKSGSRRMTVRFRSAVCEPEEPHPGYYTYRVEGVDEWLWLAPPTRITIEYHRHLQITD
jgi:hypothetical protein